MKLLLNLVVMLVSVAAGPLAPLASDTGVDFHNEPTKRVWSRARTGRDARVRSRAGHGGAHAHDGVAAMSIDYEIDGEVFEGYVAYPTHANPKMPDGLPGLVIAHAWYGLGEGEMMRAEEAAEHGYVAFALDMYGKNKRATDRGGAAALIGELNAKGRDVVKMRAEMGLAQLRETGVVAKETNAPAVDESLLFASGYCSGGFWATEMARNAMGVIGVSAFHSNYANITAYTDAMADVYMQYHHAQFDRVGDEGLLELEGHLDAAGVNVWETLKYGGTSHGFADPTNSVFDERAAVQSHKSMYDFFSQLMPEPVCVDSDSWAKNREPSKDCAWVSKYKEKRCFVKGADKTLAQDACGCACA